MESRVASSLGLRHTSIPARAIGQVSCSKPAPAICSTSQYKTALPLWRRGVQQHQAPSVPQAANDVSGYSVYNSTPSAPELPTDRMGEAARKALTRATTAVKRYGWISFWVQLTLSVVSGVILLFSVAFTSQSGPKASLYLTLIGILAGFLSTFWNFSYTRTGLKMQRYLDAPPGVTVPKIKKQNVVDMVTRGVIINVLGLGSTLLGIQALVGVLVAKTLSNASANPFIASAANVYNPVLALDVFLVQAATNMLLGHFLSMVCSLWLLSVVGEGRGLRFQRFLSLKRLRRRVEDNSTLVISKGNAARFIIDPRTMGMGAAGDVGQVFKDALNKARRDTAALGSSSSGGWGPSASSSGSSAAASGSGTASSSAGGASWGIAGSGGQVPQWGVKTRIGPAIAAAPGQGGRGSGGGRRGRRGRRSTDLPAARSALGLPAVSSSPGLSRPMDELILADRNSLSYLDGTLPGDMGFDPLGLFAPDNGDAGFMNQRWLRYAEVIHGRWAMLGVMGCLAPEYLAYQKVIPEEHGVVWFKSGFLPPAGQDYEFFMDSYSLTWVMLILMAFAETRRLQDFNAPGSLMAQPLPFGLERLLTTAEGGDPVYPGGPLFNFLDVVESESATERFKEKEIKHGRLAMVGMLGLFAQAAATRDGPYQNLLDHMFSPLEYNILTNLPYVNE